MKLGLGTAQFGSDYGVTNTRGKVPAEEVGQILRLAADNGIDLLDTAAAYGDSEAALGKALWQGHPFRIVTKCPPVRSQRILPQDARRARDAFLRSLENLRQPSVYGLLVHGADDLAKPGAELLVEQMLELKRQGLVCRIGASFYRGAQIHAAAAMLRPEIVQVPVNVADQRLVADGALRRLRDQGAEIHARSIFLQGLLLTECERIPVELSKLAPPLQRIESHARTLGISKLALALAFLAQIREIDEALVGVSSVAELRDILAAAKSVPPAGDLSSLQSDNEELLDPSRWPKAKAESDA